MTVVQGGRILDLPTGRLGNACDVHIDDREVIEIAPVAARTRLERHVTTIDAEGCVVLPGFRNAHAHSAMVLFRGLVEDVSIVEWFNEHIWIVEQNLTPDDVYWGTLLASVEMLRAGVTSVNDHYFAMDRAADAYEASGMRANLAVALFGTAPGAADELRSSVAFAKEVSTRSPLLTGSLGPHSPYICPERFLRDAVEAASRDSLPLHIHVSETHGQVEESLRTHGATPVAYLDRCGAIGPSTLLAHAYYATNDDLDTIAERGATIAHCPKTFLKFGMVTDVLPRALARSIRVALGSDGAASNNTMSMLEQVRLAALTAKGATGDATAAPVGAVAPLLTAAGTVAGLPAQTTVHVGSPPDVVVLRMDGAHTTPARNMASHLVYSAQERDIEWVVAGGRVVMQQGHHVSLDEREIITRCEAIAERLAVHHSSRPMQTF